MDGNRPDQAAMNMASSEKPDFSACAEEPIHIPGSIQPHGLLLVVDEAEMRILQVSENSLPLTGFTTEQLLNQNLDTLIGESQLEELLLALRLEAEEPRRLNPFKLKIAQIQDCQFDAVIHRVDRQLVIELEPAQSELPINALEFFRTGYQAISAALACETIDSLLETMATLTRTLTGFGRVMIYRFAPDWSGSVLAESRSADMESYLGMHFPASDIPAQARTLYEKNRLRLLVDIDASPAKIIRSKALQASPPLDLTSSVLRSLSPVHAEYLRNMQVVASMSISLIDESGALRGLIACHHPGPRYVSYQQRAACDFLAQLGSLKLAALESENVNTQQIVLQEKIDKLLIGLGDTNDLASALIEAKSGLLDVCEASGAAIISGDTRLSLGLCPDKTELANLRQLLKDCTVDVIFSTDCLSDFAPQAKAYTTTASGLLAIKIAADGERWLLWFRPELLKEIKWAGSPEKSAILTRDNKIHPRTSFAVWREQISGRSRPWSSAQINSVLELRTRLLEKSLTITERQAKVAIQLQMDQLKRLNIDLALNAEQLSLATQNAIDASQRKSEMVALVSHDLRAPLTSIHGALSLLAAGQLTEIEARELSATAYTNTTYLLNLIKNLLNLETIESRAFTLTIGPLKLQNLFENCSSILKNLADEARVKLLIAPTNITITGDSEKLLQVMVNLVSNAIKYSPPSSSVEMSAISESDANNGVKLVTIRVQDFGRGVPAEFQETIFRRFGQVTVTDRTEKGGTGLGLAISKALIETHGGTIGVESNEGQGSIFWCKLPLHNALTQYL